MRSTVKIVSARAVTGRLEEECLGNLITHAVKETLGDAGYPLAEIESIVGLGSDADDGGLSPLLRSSAAGGYGKDYLHLTGSSGQALSAGRSLLSAGLARRSLVVGWCPAAKDAAAVNLEATADPFYMRPVGASPQALRALLADHLRRAEHLEEESADTLQSPFERVDQACAVLLEIGGKERTDRPALSIEGCGLSHRNFFPAPEELDPARWIDQAWRASGATADAQPREIHIVGMPGAARSRVQQALSKRWSRESPEISLSAPRGGAVSGLACLADIQSHASSTTTEQETWLIELDGPVGQAVSFIRLRGGCRQ